MVERNMPNRKVASGHNARPWGYPRLDHVSVYPQLKTTLYIDGKKVGQVTSGTEMLDKISVRDTDGRGYARGNGLGNRRTSFDKQEASGTDQDGRRIRIVHEPNV